MQPHTLGCCSTLQSDISLFTSRSPTGGLQYQADLSTEIQPAFPWMISVQQSVCFHFIYCVCVCSPSLWCHDEWGANKAVERPRERRGEEKRSLLCLFIALFHHGNHLIYSEHFSIHLLLSLAKPIFYLHQRCVWVCVSVCVRESREWGKSSKLAACSCVCTWAVALMNSHCTSVNISKQIYYVGIYCLLVCYFNRLLVCFFKVEEETAFFSVFLSFLATLAAWL